MVVADVTPVIVTLACPVVVAHGGITPFRVLLETRVRTRFRPGPHSLSLAEAHIPAVRDKSVTKRDKAGPLSPADTLDNTHILGHTGEQHQAVDLLFRFG
jgi:hypothetical protein